TITPPHVSAPVEPGTAVPFVLASRSIVRQEVSVRNRIQPITGTSAWTKRPATLIRGGHAEGSSEFGMCSLSYPAGLLLPLPAAREGNRTRMAPSPQVNGHSLDD